MQSSRRCRNAVLAVLLLCSLSLFAERVPITILQINDLYEITPVAGGKQGGLARLATVKKRLVKENPNTYMFLAGDVFSPSALGTAKLNGKAIAGEQMIAVLNKVGLDYATFGNHEFDLTEEQFNARVKQSTAQWFSGNVRNAAGQPFDKVKDHVIFTVKGPKGAVVRVGAIGVTLPATLKPWVTYKNYLDTARAEAKLLRPQVDVLIALTHLAIADDLILAKEVPELDMIMGGHEHENIQVWRGPDMIPITKADANVRSAYVHRLVYDTAAKKLTIKPELQQINSSIPEDAATAKLVDAWVKKAFDAFRSNGFEPEQVIAKTDVVLDGKEKDVRNTQTNLTDLIARAMLAQVPGADASIYNSGSIRIDDDLPAGPITQYDIIRVLPFGGKILEVDMKGSLLERTLEAGWKNQGSGGWLQWANITRTPGSPVEWLIHGRPIEPNKTYKIAITDFLMTGAEQNIGFLTRQDPAVEKVLEHRDIRFAVIEELRKTTSK
jgi:5'-nucleotidase / UDP-sugar diphosphatase